MKTKLPYILVVAALLAASGIWWWKQNETTTPSYRDVTVTRGRIAVTVQSTGTVQPRNRLEIKPPLAGRAEQVLVAEGQVVKKGQVLLWMSSSERAALLDAARARGEDEVRRWEEFYRATPVTSPIDGTVILRRIEPGQSFTGTDVLLVIADRLLVEAQVDETDLAQIRLRLPATIVLDAYAGEAIPARVSALAFEAKTVSNVTTYTVDVSPERVPPRMRSGMTANVTFLVSARENVLTVPAHSLHERNGQYSVLVPGENGATREQAVQVGLSDGRVTEILSGLKEGDTVLVAQVRRERNPGGSPFSPGRKRKKDSS